MHSRFVSCAAPRAEASPGMRGILRAHARWINDGVRPSTAGCPVRVRGGEPEWTNLKPQASLRAGRLTFRFRVPRSTLALRSRRGMEVPAVPPPVAAPRRSVRTTSRFLAGHAYRPWFGPHPGHFGPYRPRVWSAICPREKSLRVDEAENGLDTGGRSA